MQGIIEGKASAIGLTSTSDVALDAMASEAMATAAIEGERLSLDAVRSSVMRRLGLPTGSRRSAPSIAGWPRERPQGGADPLGWW